MAIQKIQTSAKSVKGFTLVELIVVITILVILGTIAFLNLGSFSAGARDSQRTSDLNQINTQISVTQAKQGITYSTLVTSSTNTLMLTGISLAGNTVAASSGATTVGDFNYGAVGIDGSKMKDPLGKAISYKIGQTTLGGGQYEIAATLEDNNGSKAALVMGTYRSRTQSSTASSGAAILTSGSTNLTLSTTTNNFKTNDVIVGTTAGTGQITAISSDGKTITLAAGSTLALTATGDTVKLATSDESKGLISSGGVANNSAVTNLGSVLPYLP